MKHGVAFRKFSRTSSHRMLMLRNLVTSLIQHEQIKTTLPKARDTARLAEKLITLGKKGNLPALRKASGFLLDQSLVPKVFADLSKRYSERPGGYTRIHKYGNRPGDNAPHAILELVDNPRDLRFAMTARAIGWEMLGKKVGQQSPREVAVSGIPEVAEVIKREQHIGVGKGGQLRPVTRKNLQKVLKYRDSGGVSKLTKLTEDHVDTLLARPLALKEMILAKQEQKDKKVKGATTFDSLRLKAGQTLPGGSRSTLHLAQGALGKENPGRWRFRFLEREKLGVDKIVWDQL